MQRFSRSGAYVKMRLVNGAIFMLLGVVVASRGFIVPGPPAAKIPLMVLAGAMFALGFFRIRAYLQAKAQS
jgi:hypothetical protein